MNLSISPRRRIYNIAHYGALVKCCCRVLLRRADRRAAFLLAGLTAAAWFVCPSSVKTKEPTTNAQTETTSPERRRTTAGRTARQTPPADKPAAKTDGETQTQRGQGDGDQRTTQPPSSPPEERTGNEDRQGTPQATRSQAGTAGQTPRTTNRQENARTAKPNNAKPRTPSQNAPTKARAAKNADGDQPTTSEAKSSQGAKERRRRAKDRTETEKRKANKGTTSKRFATAAARVPRSSQGDARGRCSRLPLTASKPVLQREQSDEVVTLRLSLFGEGRAAAAALLAWFMFRLLPTCSARQHEPFPREHIRSSRGGGLGLAAAEFRSRRFLLGKQQRLQSGLTFPA